MSERESLDRHDAIKEENEENSEESPHESKDDQAISDSLHSEEAAED